MTEWREIDGYPGYDVSDDGRVRSWKRMGPGTSLADRPRVLKPGIANGYRHVVLCGPNHTKPRAVHRLVIEAFVGPCPDGMECCHNDGNRANNHTSNLRWDTRTGNMADALRHGTLVAGERHYASKLTWEAVRAIRASDEPQEVLALRYGVKQPAISNVIHRRRWKHDPLEQAVTP